MDDRGISPLIGFVLIILLVVTFLGAVQTTIPHKCKEKEAGHINTLESQIAEIKDVPSTISTYKIDMRADYPQYLFLMTPSTMSTTVTIQKFNLTLEYELVLVNGSKVDRKENITSSRLKISPNYLYYPRESLILENTALFKKTAGNEFLTLSDQTVFREDVTLKLKDCPHGSMSLTGSKTFYLTVEPISSGGSMLVEDLQITFESVNPHYWKSIPDYDVAIDGDKVTIKKRGLTSLSYIYALIYGSSTGTKIDYSNYASQNWNLSTQTRMVQKIDHQLVFSSNETELLDVLVTVDGYNNPVEGCGVEGTTTIGHIIPKTKHTDSQGEALFLYAAPEVKHKPQTGVITFDCSNCTTQKIITYDIEVLPGKPGCDNC